MCGRFETKKIEKSLLDLFASKGLKVEIEKEIDDLQKEDIRPTQKIISVLLKEDIYKITKVDWGIKFSDSSPLIFNSRIETIKEKKFWTGLFSKNRCIVPMTGFFEWKKVGSKKIKYRINLPDEEIFFVPALFNYDNKKKICASLITTTPNKIISSIHHRMPVILDIESAMLFLSNDAKINFDLCVPYSDNKKMKVEEAD